MSNYSKNNSRNVVTINNATPNNASQSSKMCLFEPRVFSDTQDIADELKNRHVNILR